MFTFIFLVKDGGNIPHKYFLNVQTECNQILHGDTATMHVCAELIRFVLLSITDSYP